MNVDAGKVKESKSKCCGRWLDGDGSNVMMWGCNVHARRCEWS